jgi:hypothetical protein
MEVGSVTTVVPLTEVIFPIGTAVLTILVLVELVEDELILGVGAMLVVVLVVGTGVEVDPDLDTNMAANNPPKANNPSKANNHGEQQLFTCLAVATGGAILDDLFIP